MKQAVIVEIDTLESYETDSLLPILGKVLHTCSQMTRSWDAENMQAVDLDKTLIIEKVNLHNLDSQRLNLVSALQYIPDGTAKEGVEAIVAMLDAWSDERHKEEGVNTGC